MSDFEAALDAWIDRAEQQGRDLMLGIAMAAHARVQELTPVDTGHLRASWAVVTSLDAIPKSGSAAPPADYKLGDVLYIVNPVEYARRIEYGFVGKDSRGRSYNQQGRGMVAQTMVELPSIADRVAAALRSGGRS